MWSTWAALVGAALGSVMVRADALKPPKCAVVEVSGLGPSDDGGTAMGAYEIQDQLVGRRPVYRGPPLGLVKPTSNGEATQQRYHWIYYSPLVARWVVGHNVGAADGNTQGEFHVSSSASSADRIGRHAMWSVFSTGAFHALGKFSIECIASCKILTLTGDPRSGADKHVLGNYVLQQQLVNNRPVYALMEDSTVALAAPNATAVAKAVAPAPAKLKYFLFYNTDYHCWGVVSGSPRGNAFSLFISSNAHSPDRVTGVWQVAVNSSFVSDRGVGMECATICQTVRLFGQHEGLPHRYGGAGGGGVFWGGWRVYGAVAGAVAVWCGFTVGFHRRRELPPLTDVLVPLSGLPRAQ
jgi:hypothetical protein